MLGVGDIDLFFDALGTSSNVEDYDLNGDSLVNETDVNELVVTRIGTTFGDIDLDGDVDIFDLNSLIVNFDPLGTNADNGWEKGNFDGDSDVDIFDLVTMVANFNPLGNS